MFIPTRLITFTTCEIFYYWNSINHLVHLPPVLSYLPCRWVDQFYNKIFFQWNSINYSVYLPPKLNKVYMPGLHKTY